MPSALRSFMLCMLAAAPLAVSAQDDLAATGARRVDPAPAAAPAHVCAKPVYPQEALAAKWTGASTIAFLIGADGTVKDSRVARSSGHRVLDEAAVNALSGCRFKPAKDARGEPVASWQPVQYVWSLD